MFAPIKNHTSVHIDYAGLFEQSLEHFRCDMTSLDEAESLSDVMIHLKALQTSIEVYGCTAALMTFANSDGALSNAIPSIPSLETFIATESFDTELAVEGIVSKIKETAGKWYKAVKAHIIKYKAFYKNALAIAVLLIANIAADKMLTKKYTFKPTAEQKARADGEWQAYNERAQAWSADYEARRKAWERARKAASDAASGAAAHRAEAMRVAATFEDQILKHASVLKDIPSGISGGTINECANHAQKIKAALEGNNSVMENIRKSIEQIQGEPGSEANVEKRNALVKVFRFCSKTASDLMAGLKQTDTLSSATAKCYDITVAA